MKTYMVIENIRNHCLDKVYERFNEKGRMLPEGLYYIDSWLERSGARCFQLMETANPALFDQWIAQWSDLADFEVIEIRNKPNA